MNFTPSSKPELPGFPLTPMIDVVFLLLCFFVTSAVYSQWEYEVDIQLPTAQTGRMPERSLPGEIIINLAENGDIRVTEKLMTPEQLLSKLRMLASNFPGNPVVLRSDLRTPYEHVMRVIDLCRQADIDNISFATDLPASEPSTPDEP
jgi:biopolymer transport protein ExbD